MAVMVNSMGGGTELRGPIYAKEFKTDVTDELTEVVNLAGPGRLLYAMVTRMQSGSGNSYSATMDNIFVKIIPDGDDTKTLKKTHGGDNCSSSSHGSKCDNLDLLHCKFSFSKCSTFFEGHGGGFL